MITADIIQRWVNTIGNYELEVDSPAEQLAANFDINYFLTPEAQEKLYEGAHPADSPEPTVARKHFLRFLGRKFQDISWQANRANKTVNLADFLQDDEEDGFALYKAAIEEESKSRAFRNAVFFRCLKHFPGNKWAEIIVLWVGGPSSSGKTYAAKGVLEKMDLELLQKTDQPGGNNVVSVDGSYERETSQMRQMVLQFALAAGYKGIEDLHENSKKELAVKTCIRDAALEDGRLSLVVPDTFVRSPLEVNNECKAYAKKKITQAFAEVKGEKGFGDRFQTSVKKMGDARAWNNKKFTAANIKMNNRNIGCESKVYEGEYFKFGLLGTKVFKKFFKSFTHNKLTLTVTNDLVYLVKKEGIWKECEYEDNLDGKQEGRDFIRMTARAYNYWRDNNISEPLETWFDTKGKHIKTLTEQVITHKTNTKYFEHHAFFNLLRTNKWQRRSQNSAEKEKRKIRHLIAVNDETIASLEAKIQTSDVDIELLTKKLTQCKLLQATLKEKLAELEGKKEVVESSTQFLPYLHGYIDIPVEDKNTLLGQAVPGAKPATSLSANDDAHGEFIAPQLKDNFCRVHYAENTSDPSSQAMFIQEKTEEGMKLTAVRESMGKDPVSLMESALTMANCMLLALNEPPSPKNKLAIYGADPVLINYLWTALVVLGEKSSSRKFGKESIAVIAGVFSVAEQMKSSNKFSPQSLHETVFKDHEAFIDIKVKELERLLELKANPENLLGKTLLETTDHVASKSGRS
ncbi:hypothetical protein [Legionella jamestowniensis]|uniref:Interaptin n=1 Tax=Legionella jamestowniensis TaxID=455 RepID=A0A0W0UZH7_9GAMM|nr:hypothetical protein [Legionella jamestowniensis]KTD13268.1 interaptin [Legionella jamestowniensis]SFL77864.1 hypothetical protein SAMN02746073_1870 [Legionella jamestowniensis DSM 19215]